MLAAACRDCGQQRGACCQHSFSVLSPLIVCCANLTNSSLKGLGVPAFGPVKGAGFVGRSGPFPHSSVV